MYINTHWPFYKEHLPILAVSQPANHVAEVHGINSCRYTSGALFNIYIGMRSEDVSTVTLGHSCWYQAG